jgi:tRNA(Ile2) C34 agmatinyltransferase TiaS
LFYEVFINVNLQENVFRIKEMMGLIVESQDEKVTCDECGWSWKLSEGGDDPYTCHKCGHTNKVNEEEITERCWKGYTQKGMKTMFGKRYPNCVKKTK